MFNTCAYYVLHTRNAVCADSKLHIITNIVFLHFNNLLDGLVVFVLSHLSEFYLTLDRHPRIDESILISRIS